MCTPGKDTQQRESEELPQPGTNTAFLPRSYPQLQRGDTRVPLKPGSSRASKHAPVSGQQDLMPQACSTRRLYYRKKAL